MKTFIDINFLMLTISVLDTKKKTRTNFEKNPEVSNGQNLREHWTVSLNFSSVLI